MEFPAAKYTLMFITCVCDSVHGGDGDVMMITAMKMNASMFLLAMGMALRAFWRFFNAVDGRRWNACNLCRDWEWCFFFWSSLLLLLLLCLVWWKAYRKNVPQSVRILYIIFIHVNMHLTVWRFVERHFFYINQSTYPALTSVEIVYPLYINTQTYTILCSPILH